MNNINIDINNNIMNILVNDNYVNEMFQQLNLNNNHYNQYLLMIIFLIQIDDEVRDQILNNDLREIINNIRNYIFNNNNLINNINNNQINNLNNNHINNINNNQINNINNNNLLNNLNLINDLNDIINDLNNDNENINLNNIINDLNNENQNINLNNIEIRPAVREIRCPICLEDIHQNEMCAHTRCDHQFHQNCIQPWLNNHNNCPYCRQEL